MCCWIQNGQYLVFHNHPEFGMHFILIRYHYLKLRALSVTALVALMCRAAVEMASLPHLLSCPRTLKMQCEREG